MPWELVLQESPSSADAIPSRGYLLSSDPGLGRPFGPSCLSDCSLFARLLPLFSSFAFSFPLTPMALLLVFLWPVLLLLLLLPNYSPTPLYFLPSPAFLLLSHFIEPSNPHLFYLTSGLPVLLGNSLWAPVARVGREWHASILMS